MELHSDYDSDRPPLIVPEPVLSITNTQQCSHNSYAQHVAKMAEEEIYIVTVTGTSGTTVHSTSVTLVVNSSAGPDFSISASPASLTVTRGMRGSYTVTVTALNGFTGVVTFSASGLPANTLSQFSPTSVTGSGTSTFTVGASTTTPTGTVTLTIKGTSGSLVHSTTVSLTVKLSRHSRLSQRYVTATLCSRCL